MMKRIRQWLRMSSRAHIHEQPVHDLSSCVALLDRFLDGSLRYPLEWDDFVSWPHEHPGIESIRNTVADTEPLFFSRDLSKWAQGRAIVLDERNRIAGILGLPARELLVEHRMPPNNRLQRTGEG